MLHFHRSHKRFI